MPELVFYEEAMEITDAQFERIRDRLRATKPLSPIDSRRIRSIMTNGDWWEIAKKYAKEST